MMVHNSESFFSFSYFITGNMIYINKMQHPALLKIVVHLIDEKTESFCSQGASNGLQISMTKPKLGVNWNLKKYGNSP